MKLTICLSKDSSTPVAAMTMPIETLATCHWPLKNGAEVKGFLTESRQFAEVAERLVLDELRKRAAPVTLGAVIAALGPQLGSWPRAADSE